MYKLLLCLRYLRTRYIALASIISVTLGVATMIVVNSVMAGFTTEMKDRIRGLLADVVIETHSLQGHEDPEGLIARAMAAAPGMIEAATPTVEMYAVMSFDYGGEPIHRPVQLIGIDPRGKSKVSPLKANLVSYQPVMKDGKVVEPAARSMEEELSWSLTPEAMELCRRMRDLDVLRHRLASAQAPQAAVVPAGGAAQDEEWGEGSDEWDGGEEWAGDSQPYAPDANAGAGLVQDPFALVGGGADG
ncbi:ABC transporter permease, partial [Alienimonas sp. DA493]|uniref:ABC transporter permease n=1 Tax=Alienimonas sp. DA493 TaxID=3373605 RepID=UPI003754904E